MNPNEDMQSANRQAALNGLAVVGFVALVGAGIWLAIYSARFVPGAVGRLGTAAVSLSSIFNGGGNSLSVVPSGTGTTTDIDLGGATSTPATSTPATTEPSHPITPVTAGPETSNTVALGTTTAPAAGTRYGLPDLTVSITAVGYLTSTDTNSFVVATSTGGNPVIPHGMRPAVRFTVRNIGTNTAGSWQFQASIPTQVGYQYQSVAQQPLNPGDSIDYTLGFDQPNLGTQTISINANYNNAILEATTNNNTSSVQVTIQ